MSPEYLAGFIDGEGCIRISGTSPYLSLTNRSLPGLLEIQESFGGNVRPSGNGVQRYEAYGDRAVKILHYVYRHLREKQPQARLVMSFPSTEPGSHERDMILRALRDLKRVTYGEA